MFVCLIPLVSQGGLFAKSFGDKQVDDLYEKVLDATFPDEKEVFTIKLGERKSKAAKKALLALLDDSDSWNQEAAITGLLLLNMPEIDQILIDRMLTEFMIDDDIKEGIIKYADRFTGPLINQYKKVTSEEDRRTLLETIAQTKNTKAMEFLKSIVKDKKSSDRSMAFQYLIEHFKVKKEYVATFYKDQELKEYALSWLVDNGTQQDLALFLGIIQNKKEKETTIIIGYEAVNKWGNDDLKQKIYLGALKNDNETLVRGALYIFKGAKSDAIISELCRLTKKGEQQDTRIIAASTLGKFNEKKTVPFLISVLKEDYTEENNPIGIEILATIFTFGISSILDRISANMDRNDFNSQMGDIAEGLSWITGADYGTSYEEWLDWGVLHGYTVDGINIIQYIFELTDITRIIVFYKEL